mgnify:CR=1 FL=1
MFYKTVVFDSSIEVKYQYQCGNDNYEKIRSCVVYYVNRTHQNQIAALQITVVDFDPEFRAVLTKVDDLAGEIAKNFVNLQYEQKKSSILLHSVNQGIVVVSKSNVGKYDYHYVARDNLAFFRYVKTCFHSVYAVAYAYFSDVILFAFQRLFERRNSTQIWTTKR